MEEVKPEVKEVNNQDDFQKGLDNLLEGDWPGLDAEPSPKPDAVVDPEPKKEPEPKLQPEAEPKTEPQPDITPETKLYKYRGKEYTSEQLIEQGLLEDALTSAEQMPHYQKKYETLLEERRATQPVEQAPTQPAQPRPTPEQVLNHYAPTVDQAIAEGWIEPEMKTVFPNFTANMMYFREMIMNLHQAVGMLASRERSRDLGGLKSRVDGFIDNTCLTLAQRAKTDPKAKHFELLEDDKVRSGFRDHIYKLDPKVDSVTEDFIRTQWLAYNSDALVEALQASNTRDQAGIDDKRRLAKGESGVNTRPVVSKDEPTHLDSLLEGSFPSGG